MKFCSRNKIRKKRGSILIFVLALVALMSIIITKFLRVTVDEIERKNLQNMESSLKMECYSYLHATLGVMSEYKELEGNLYSPLQAWGNPIEYMELEDLEDSVEILIEDESSKFPINHGDPELWDHIFAVLEVPFSERQQLTDSLLDWIDADDLERLNGAERNYYESLEDPVLISNSPPVSYGEIMSIQGFASMMKNRSRFYKDFTSLISLYHDGSLNINTASESAIEAFARRNLLDSTRILNFLCGEDGIRGTEDDRYFNDLSDPELSDWGKNPKLVFSLNPEVFKIQITVKRGENNFTIVCVCSLKNGKNKREEWTDPIGSFKIIKLVENLKI